MWAAGGRTLAVYLPLTCSLMEILIQNGTYTPKRSKDELVRALLAALMYPQERADNYEH